MNSDPSRIDRLLSRLRGASVMRSDPSIYTVHQARTGAESVMDMTPTFGSSTRVSSSVNMVNRMGLTNSGRTALALSTAARSGTLAERTPSNGTSPANRQTDAQHAQHPGGGGVSPFVTAQPPHSSDEEEVVAFRTVMDGSALSAVQEQGMSVMTSGTLLQGVSMRSMQCSDSSLPSLPSPPPGGVGVQQLARVVRESIALNEQDMEAARDMAQLFVVQREDMQPM